MVLNSQGEYTQFYNKLKRYATTRAYGLFSDTGLRGEAIDKALDKFTNELLKNPQVDSLEAFAKTVVYNSLKNSVRDKKLDLAPSTEKLTQEGRLVFGDATRIKQVVYKGKYPAVNILLIKDKKERKICLDYWQCGLKVTEIAQKMELTPRRIQQIIAKYVK